MTQYFAFSAKEVPLSAKRRSSGQANTEAEVNEPLAAIGSRASSADGVNLKQAAALLGVHYMTVYRYVRQGRLPAERIGTEWRVSRRVLESFKTGPPQAAAAGEVSTSTR